MCSYLSIKTYRWTVTALWSVSSPYSRSIIHFNVRCALPLLNRPGVRSGSLGNSYRMTGSPMPLAARTITTIIRFTFSQILRNECHKSVVRIRSRMDGSGSDTPSQPILSSRASYASSTMRSSAKLWPTAPVRGNSPQPTRYGCERQRCATLPG